MSKKQKVRTKKNPTFDLVLLGSRSNVDPLWISQLEKKYPDANIYESKSYTRTNQSKPFTIICKADDLPHPKELGFLLKSRKQLKTGNKLLFLPHKQSTCIINGSDWAAVKDDLDLLDYRIRQTPFDSKGIYPPTKDISSKSRKKGLKQWLHNYSQAFQWYFHAPIKSGLGNNPHSWRFGFASVLTILLFCMLFMSQQAGISGDEFRYHNQSAKVFNYFVSGGSNKSAVTQSGIDPQHFNAQSFDVIMYTLEKWFGVDDRFDMRHFFNALIGWVGIFFVGLLVSKLLGWQAGILAVLLLFFSPRYFGHSLNNHRDIPSAVATIASFYYAILYFRTFPRPRLKYVVYLGLSIAAAFSIRLASGVLIVGLLGVFTVVHILTSSGKLNTKLITSNFIDHSKYLIPTVVIGYLLGILLWPFGLEGPIQNALLVLRQSSNLGVSLRQVFDGSFVMSNEIPWYYVSKYLLISIPAVVFIGIGLFAWRSTHLWSSRNRRFPIFILVFSIMFTIFYASMFVKNDYGGWRHFLFIYPPIVCLAAMGYASLQQLLPEKVQPYFLPICLILAIHPIRYTFANHPYQYTYFNELFGGVNNALGKFEQDYSLNSMQEGIDWLKENVPPKSEGKWTVAANDPSQVKWGFRSDTAHYNPIYVRYYEKYSKDWDYAVLTNLYVSPSQLRGGYWPPENTIHEVMVDNVVLTAVVERKNKVDLEGYQAVKSGNHNLAVQKFNAFLAENPNNDQALAALSNSFLSIGDNENALEAANRALKAHPESIQALHVKGLSYLNKQDYSNAERIYAQATEVQSNNYAMHYYYALSLYNNKKLNEAIQAATMSVRLNAQFRQGFDLLIKMYEETGQTAAAQQYRQYIQNL